MTASFSYLYHLLKTIAPASTTSFVIPTPASLATIAPSRSPILLDVPDDDAFKHAKDSYHSTTVKVAFDEEYDPDECYCVEMNV
jgi:hypothetical protein